MHEFDFITRPGTLLTPEVVSLLTRLHECRGRQELFIEAEPDILTALVEVAKIQSTGASNRIEGIYTTDDRLNALVQDKVKPRNRNEEEISGYRDVLATIHESYEYIAPRPNNILQLHRDLYSFSSSSVGGTYKNSDNIIADKHSGPYCKKKQESQLHNQPSQSMTQKERIPVSSVTSSPCGTFGSYLWDYPDWSFPKHPFPIAAGYASFCLLSD